MKKSLHLSLMAAGAALLTSGAVQEAKAETVLTQPECTWGNTFYGETTAGNQVQGNTIVSDGGVVWHLAGGSNHDSRDIYYAGSVLFQGSDYNEGGTSNNNNLCILKTDKDGNKVWDLHSTTCDFASNQGDVVAMPDGGVVFTAKVRCTDLSAECQWEPITLIDGKNATHTLEWEHTATDTKRYYKGIIGRLDKDGGLVWLKELVASRAAQPNGSGSYADYTAEALYLNALAADGTGNIYVGGNFRNPMTYPGSDMNLVPTNTVNWTGDTQSTVGDLYIIKIDADGKYVKSLATAATNGSVNCQRLRYENGKIYSAIYATGEGTVALGDKNFTVEGLFSPAIAEFDTDLNAEWISAFKGEKDSKNKNGFQNTDITIVNNALWFTGQFQGKISDAAGNSFESTTTMREGFLLKLNAADGSWIKATTSAADAYTAGLTGYFKAIQNPVLDSKVYVYGYTMSKSIFMRTYDATTLESDPDTEWELVTGGGASTCQTIAYDADDARIYITARGKAKDFVTLDGPTVSLPSTPWSILLAGYNMPSDFKTAVEGIEAVGNESAVNAPVYDLQGRVAGMTDAEGNLPALAPGLYIAAGKKVLVK